LIVLIVQITKIHVYSYISLSPSSPSPSPLPSSSISSSLSIAVARAALRQRRRVCLLQQLRRLSRQNCTNQKENSALGEGRAARTVPVVVAGSAMPARAGNADTTDTNAGRELLAGVAAAAGATILRKLALYCKTLQKYTK
jgi:hypothetical protein